jgi:hypothetical protein
MVGTEEGVAVCTIEVHTITERAEETEEAERSLESFLKESCIGSIRLSPDFHFGKVNGKNPGITGI